MSVTFNGGISPIIIHLWEIEQKTAPQKKKKKEITIFQNSLMCPHF